jgi:hypothetical protein
MDVQKSEPTAAAESQPLATGPPEPSGDRLRGLRIRRDRIIDWTIPTQAETRTPTCTEATSGNRMASTTEKPTAASPLATTARPIRNTAPIPQRRLAFSTPQGKRENADGINRGVDHEWTATMLPLKKSPVR